MSAYVVDDNHIRLLVDIAIRGPIERDDDHPFSWYYEGIRSEITIENDEYQSPSAHRVFVTANQVFFMLLKENVKSICYRYESEKMEDYQESLLGETYHMLKRRPAAVEALKAIDCYEYQACERPSWKTSEAHSFCTSLRKYVIGYLPGYEDAPWQWTES